MKTVKLTFLVIVLVAMFSCEKKEEVVPQTVQGNSVNNISGVWISTDDYYINFAIANKINLNLSLSNFTISFEEGEGNQEEKIAAFSGNYSISGSIMYLSVLAVGTVNPETGSMEIVKKSEDDWLETLNAVNISEEEQVSYALNGETLSLTLNGKPLKFIKQ